MKYLFWLPDTIVVVAFVVIGRDDHGFVSDFGDYLRVAAPFLIALALSMLIVRAWKDILDLRVGLALAVGTVVLGMLIRRFVFDAGTAQMFIVVTTGFVLAAMVGWRMVVIAGRKVLTRQRASTA